MADLISKTKPTSYRTKVNSRKTSIDEPPSRNTAPVFSSHKRIMDYVTIPGISTRTGVETELAIFMVEELVDNAFDFVEKNAAGKNNNKKDNESAPVQVFVLRESKYLKIRVLNLNFGISVFTENIINSIFDFGGFYSSKSNSYKIGRGALGDALKEVVSIPYALAEQNGIERWNKPLIITSDNKRYFIRLIVDRVRQTIHPQVEVKLWTQNVRSTELEACSRCT
jgi:hypothetical protein